MIANVQAEGGTVFFSTHLLHEMERVADRVAILHKADLLVHGTLDQLKNETKKLRAVYPDVVPEEIVLPGLVRRVRDTHQVLLTVTGYNPSLDEELRRSGAETVEVIDLSLEEIFVETVKGGTTRA
jgi:ABC-2 type transport system ATP-binding protein